MEIDNWLKSPELRRSDYLIYQVPHLAFMLFLRVGNYGLVSKLKRKTYHRLKGAILSYPSLGRERKRTFEQEHLRNLKFIFILNFMKMSLNQDSPGHT